MGHSDQKNDEAISEFWTNLKDELKSSFCIPQRSKIHGNQTRRSNTDGNARPPTRKDLHARSSRQNPDSTASDPDENQDFDQTGEAGRGHATTHDEQSQIHHARHQPTAAPTLALRAPSTCVSQHDGRGALQPKRMSNSNNRSDSLEHGGPAAEPIPPPIPPKHGLPDGSEQAESSTNYRQQRRSLDVGCNDGPATQQSICVEDYLEGGREQADIPHTPTTSMDHNVVGNNSLDYENIARYTRQIGFEAPHGQPDPMDGSWRGFPAGPFQVSSEHNEVYAEEYWRMKHEGEKKEEKLQWAFRCLREDQKQIKDLERALSEAEEREKRYSERRPKPPKRDRALAELKARVTALEGQNNKQKAEISRLRQAEQSLQRNFSHINNENGVLSKSLQEAFQVLGLRDEETRDLRSVLRSTQGEFERTQKLVQDIQQDKHRVELAYGTEIRLATQRQQEFSDKFEALEKRHLEETSTSAIRHQAEIEGLKEEHAQQLSRAKTDHDELTKDLSNKIALRDLRMAAFSSSGNYKPTLDSGFGQTLQSLSQQVKNLTAYIPTTNHVPVDPSLDPTDYLSRSRHSSRGWQHFVRSLCWKIIIRGFFAFQLGFGSLGSRGEGFQSLLMFYQLFARPNRNHSSSKSLVFPTDRETNLGRAWFFDGLLQSVRSNASGDGFVSMFYKNVSYVADELTDTLRRLNNGSLVPRAEAQIQNLMKEFGELALQMGSQRAQVFLEICRHGDIISPGERFTEEAESRDTVEVDLMIQPGLVRIGDGREDVSSETVIAKGAFISLKGVSNH